MRPIDIWYEGSLDSFKIKTTALRLGEVQQCISREAKGVVPGELINKLGYDKLHWQQLAPQNTQLPTVFIGTLSPETPPIFDYALGVIDISEIAQVVNGEGVATRRLRLGGVIRDSNETQRAIGVSYNAFTQRAYNILISLSPAEFRAHDPVHPQLHVDIPTSPYWPYLTAGFITRQMIGSTASIGKPHEKALRFYDSTNQGYNLLCPLAQKHYPRFGYGIEATSEVHRISFTPALRTGVLVSWSFDLLRKLEQFKEAQI